MKEIVGSWKQEGIRKTIVENFLIYYWADKKNLKVQVIAVIYNRRDQLRVLMNMEYK